MLETTIPEHAPPARSTAASTAFAAIRRDILSGALAPGRKLRIDGLCKAYGATINPVREALNRLTSEGLVTQEDQRGFSVAPISLEDWRDVVHARCLMEGCALGEAIRHRDETWEERVVVALHWLSRTPHWSADEKTANPDWGPRHNAFHDALLSACGSQIMLAYCRELRERADRYRHIASTNFKRRDSLDEHRAIADAAMAGDTELAVARLTQHYMTTFAVIERYFARNSAA